jgi:hypothetical protein
MEANAPIVQLTAEYREDSELLLERGGSEPEVQDRIKALLALGTQTRRVSEVLNDF